MSSRSIRGWAVALAALALACAPAPATARTLETILQDDAQLLHRPESQLRRSLEELRLLGVDRIRVTAGWSVLTRDPDSETRPDFDATNPAAYEQERWRTLDRLVVLAGEYGFKTMIDIGFFAPRWASLDAPGERGRTHPDPGHFRDFATAVAKRYSGTFILPRHVQASAGIKVGSDEKYFNDLYGSVNFDSAEGLHASLGAGYLFGDRQGADAVAETLGTDGRLPTRAVPQVDVLTLWNEPNHTGFLRPQWRWRDGRPEPYSPHLYREMVRMAYPAVKEVHPDARVLVGATSFDGGRPGSGTGGVPPLRFLRELACVNRRFERLRTGDCAGFRQLPGDGWSHHPYSLSTRPGRGNPRGEPDNVPVAELPRLARTLDRLVRMGRLAPRIRHIWVTEYGYETNPPVRRVRWDPNDQAQFLPWAEYLAWRVPSVRTFAQFLLRDVPPGNVRVAKSRRRAFGQWQSGLLFADGRPKWYSPESFRAALVAERRGGRRMHFWIRLRLGGGMRTVVVERARAGSQRWRAVRTESPSGRRPHLSFTADGDAVSQRYADVERAGAHHYRLRYGTPDGWRVTPRIKPIVRRRLGFLCARRGVGPRALVRRSVCCRARAPTLRRRPRARAHGARRTGFVAIAPPLQHRWPAYTRSQGGLPLSGESGSRVAGGECVVMPRTAA